MIAQRLPMFSSSSVKPTSKLFGHHPIISIELFVALVVVANEFPSATCHAGIQFSFESFKVGLGRVPAEGRIARGVIALASVGLCLLLRTALPSGVTPFGLELTAN